MPGIKVEVIYPAIIQARDLKEAHFCCISMNRMPKAIYKLNGKGRKRIMNILKKSANRFPGASVKNKKQAEYLCKF